MLVIHIHVFLFSISSFESEKQYHIHPEWNKTNVVLVYPTNSGESQSAVRRARARCTLQMCRRFKKSPYSSRTRKWSSAKKNKILNCKQGSGREWTCAAIITVHGICTSRLF